MKFVYEYHNRVFREIRCVLGVHGKIIQDFVFRETPAHMGPKKSVEGSVWVTF